MVVPPPRITTARVVVLEPPEATTRRSRHRDAEHVFIGLSQPDGAEWGAVRFFDVEKPPARNGRPSPASTLSFDEFIDDIHAEVERRNRLAPT
jgi:hypothetical protein